VSSAKSLTVDVSDYVPDKVGFIRLINQKYSDYIPDRVGFTLCTCLINQKYSDYVPLYF
jgi:hypothetical protein